MSTARLAELRLEEFKSFRQAVLPLHDITILIGRNSSGKSNALDGLEVLARLASGEELADALDGRRRAEGAIRGGSAGLPPHGRDEFALGCMVKVDDDCYRYSIKVQVRPLLRVIEEELAGPGVSSARNGATRESVLIAAQCSDGPGISAEIHNGKRGRNPTKLFRDTRPVITQAAAILGETSRADALVLRGVGAVLSALRGVFHLDPVPHLMRNYVPERDIQLRRTGENLSAALKRLGQEDPQAMVQLREHLQAVADEWVQGVSFVTSELGDVMFVLDESRGGNKERTPARELSDGLLRFAAIATALLSSHNLDIDLETPIRGQGNGITAGVHIVIEELETGLHPAQAQRVLDLVRNSTGQGMKSLVTTHSPALLDAAEGVLNDSVYVCHRQSDSGHSAITPLVKLPGYARALAERSLGAAVTADALFAQRNQDYSEFEQLLGLR